ncbi:MAG: hypothetical protein WCL61_02900, partial [bacterium]
LNLKQDQKIWAAASYFWLLAIIVLAIKKNDDYVRFHANQGILLFILSLACFVPFFGQLLLMVVVIMMIIGMVKAFKGEKWPLPIVGDMPEKIGDWVIKTLNI